METDGIKALLIEDDPEDVLLLTYLMAQEDWPAFRFTLECADSLAAGLAVLARGGVEVVLLDLMLPDSRGLETLRVVRERAPDVPVVVLTGMSDESLGLEAVLAGAQDYQVKGHVESHALKRTIGYAVERHRLLARLKAIIDRSADGMVVVDRKGTVRYSNPAARELLAGAAGSLPGERFPFPVPVDSASEVRLGEAEAARTVQIRVTAIEWEGAPASLASMRDITDLRRVEELRAEVRERRRMDKLKDELMSAVSHEMRNPLTIIKAANINLKESLPDPQPDDVSKMLELQFSNILRLQKTLDHILDLSRLESGRAAVRLATVDAGPLLARTAEGFRLLAAERELAFEASLPQDLPAVRADAELLEQLLANLLDNAVRFARSRVTLTARVVEDPPGIRFSVADDGRGIPPDRLEEVFLKFVQVERAPDARGYKGTGLGLAICKEIVRRHEGRIWAESDVGRGATFHFELPLAAAVGRERRA